MYRVTHTTLGWIVVLLLLMTGTAHGQLQGVLLDAPRDQLGLAGNARLGAWTPLRIGLENQASEPRQVLCRWVINDADGDRLLAQRRVTLDALGKHEAWLYGALPIRWRQHEPFVIQVLSEDGQQELARADAPPPELVKPTQRMIGIAGTNTMGLTAYQSPNTSHEGVSLLPGLSLTTLPDRWYGLSAIDTLIWTRTGGDPEDPLVSSATQQALREWVRRGGHLIVMMPAFGETWTGSALGDLLPIKSDQIERLEGRPPNDLLGMVRGTEALNVEVLAFRVKASDGVSVVRRYGSRYDNKPAIVAKRYGFGRVTVFGADLSDRRFTQMGMPNGRSRVWNDVFMWQAPVYERAYIEAEVGNDKMSRPDQRNHVLLSRFIPQRISMRGAAAPALLGAILLFALYWFAAGPLSVIVLKKRDATRHSWIWFVAVVLVFSAVSWAGAWLLAPKSAAISHFSILTAEAGSSTVHTHSWLSLYMPKFGNQEIELDPDHPTARHTLASPGMVTGLDEAGFLDPQTYSVDAGLPRLMNIPFRSTAKQLELDYLGRVDLEQTGLQETLVMPQGEVRLENFWPKGSLKHDLAGPLRNVMLLYCPGDNEPPWVWRLADVWEPEQVLELGTRASSEQLVIEPKDPRYDKRTWKDEGFLGKLINARPGQALVDAYTGEEVVTTPSEMVQFIQMLCFYDTLPPPDFRRTGFPWALSYQRGLGRQLDLTPMLSERRLIILGLLQDSPLPAPLTVQGEAVTASGWTVVRFVYDL